MDKIFGLDKVSSHDEELELLTTAYDPTYLAIVESILADAQIPYLKKDRGSGAAVRVIMGYSMFGTDIFVLKEHFDAASELIATPEDEGEEISEEISEEIEENEEKDCDEV